MRLAIIDNCFFSFLRLHSSLLLLWRAPTTLFSLPLPLEMELGTLDNSDHKSDDGQLLPQRVEPSSSCSDEVDVNEVLDNIPVGFFHYRLLLICGLSFMADGEDACVCECLL